MKLSTIMLGLTALAGSAIAETITGTIYCDNYFEFYFNGELIAVDPMTFTPHNAVAVSFEWDEVSDKHYAILCQDYASESGYEYINANPGLGDGALIAEFSDGTITSADWKMFVANYGPTEASEASGCSATNLAPCVVNEIGNPDGWFGVDFDYSGWDSVTVYTAAQAGWGRAPTWVEGSGCCTATNPTDRSNLLLDGGCSVNYDSALGRGVRTTVTESECLSPRNEFATTSAQFLWGSNLEKDNRVLFRTTVAAGGSSTGATTETTPPSTLVSTTGTTTIVGTIYCDNYFEFYFNGNLVATDPMTFTPHNAVAVSFEWDGVSDKHYAILCQDFASESGYEYIEANPGLGDGALIAEFSDGTITSANWKTFVANYGPTEASEANGCSATNLAPCVVDEIGNPNNWFGVDFDYSDWDSATVYTAAQAGWGRAPTWVEGSGCCTATNPTDQSNLLLDGGCSVNYDSVLGRAVRTTVTESECLSPRDEFATTSAQFLWGSNLEKDNRVLFRTTVAADGSTPNTGTTTETPPVTTATKIGANDASSPWLGCTATADYPQCSAPARSLASQRVRKEIRSLTMDEWDKVVAAMWAMKTETMESGQAMYGSGFRTYDYFVVKHAVATTDSRGDQAHFGAHFISWHSAFVLEFENTLLAIDPTIEAMPYWDETISTPSVFTEDYFGSDPNTAVSPDVTTGKFANFPVDMDFSFDDYAVFVSDDSTITYRGTGDSLSILRGTENLGTSPVVIRQGSGSGWEANPPSIDDWWACTASGSWTDWYTCIEQGRPSFHSGPHGSIGGTGTNSIRGDFEDPITSPNGPIFMFHHANLDRNRMWWMRRNSDTTCSYYGFPLTNAAFVGPRPGGAGTSNFEGAHLNDVAASAWGFTAAELGFAMPNDDGSALTHADLTCWMHPSTAAYTYDTNAACLLDTSTCNSVQGTIADVDVVAPPPETTTEVEDSGCKSLTVVGSLFLVLVSLVLFT